MKEFWVFIRPVLAGVGIILAGLLLWFGSYYCTIATLKAEYDETLKLVYTEDYLGNIEIYDP